MPGDDVRTFPLAQPMRELYDVFEVPGAGGIPLYSWSVSYTHLPSQLPAQRLARRRQHFVQSFFRPHFRRSSLSILSLIHI